MSLSFADSDLLASLEACDDVAFDSLPFGVIAIKPDGTVVRYNRTESLFSGRSAASVVGKNFFREVALCLNTDQVAGRLLREEVVDARVPYAITFGLRPCRVELRLLRGHAARYMYVVVRETTNLR